MAATATQRWSARTEARCFIRKTSGVGTSAVLGERPDLKILESESSSTLITKNNRLVVFRGRFLERHR